MTSKIWNSLAIVAIALTSSLGAASLAPTPLLITSARAAAGESKKEVKEKSEIVLKVKGEDGTETLRFDGIEKGQTKEVRTESGKKAQVTRNASGFTVKIDGKEIKLPGGGGHGLPGGKMKRECSMESSMDCGAMGSKAGHEDCCGACERMAMMWMPMCCGGGRGMMGHGRHGHGMKMMEMPFAYQFEGSDDDEDLDIEMPGEPGTVDLGSLDSMKGVDEKTRAKVQEVLNEIHKKHGVRKIITEDIRGGGPGKKRVKVIVMGAGEDDEDDDKK